MYVEKEEKTKFEYNASNNEITQTTNTICQTIYEQARTIFTAKSLCDRLDEMALIFIII